ncbi:hypothetical protein OZ411_27100 [Bradyrhizobium sp. Arg237L]|nr:hypothetical protein [Bradyrhizobium sp. Arg237L]MDI4236487.1 hypothetical protein [Bradyrhizobium sp. Arg237L]
MIIYPCWYSGTHLGNEWLIGAGKALDPAAYFIIVPNMFGNGFSTSPSNTDAPYNGARLAKVTAFDKWSLALGINATSTDRNDIAAPVLFEL